MSYIEDQTLKKSKVGSVTHPSFDTVPSSEIHAYLNANATMITSNQRLSRFRLQTYEEKQIQSGKQAWSTPQVLPWSAWLRQQWNTSNQGVWLSSHQESLLWRACIAEDEATQVLNAKALAKQAMEACKIMSDFNIDDTCLTYAGEEHIALLRWKKEVQNKTKHVLNHHVLSMLTQDMAEQQPHTLLLDGFDSFTPAQVNYFKHLKKNGYLIFEIINDRTPANTTLHLYQDEEHEVRQVCQKVKRIINTHSLASIGILIPDLERRAPTINRIFSEELAPHLSLTTNTDIQGDYFNISLGF